MPFPEIHRPSPNFGTAPAHEQAGVCFHHSVMAFEPTIEHMLKPESQVSYHVLIAPDGTRARLVDDARIAWHAGASSFRGRARCNDFLLGVSFAGDTHRDPLAPAQIDSALEWLEHRWTRLGWTLADMTDHRQVAPGRKDDLAPGEWKRLLAAITAHFP